MSKHAPKGGLGVVVTLKSNMAASSAISGGNSKRSGSRARSKVKSSRLSRYLTAQPHQNSCQHFCHLNFPL